MSSHRSKSNISIKSGSFFNQCVFLFCAKYAPKTKHWACGFRCRRRDSRARRRTISRKEVKHIRFWRISFSLCFVVYFLNIGIFLEVSDSPMKKYISSKLLRILRQIDFWWILLRRAVVKYDFTRLGAAKGTKIYHRKTYAFDFLAATPETQSAPKKRDKNEIWKAKPWKFLQKTAFTISYDSKSSL